MADSPATDAQGRYPSRQFAMDEIGSILWPYVKLAWGPNNTADPLDVSHPLPVTDALGATAAQLTTLLAQTDGIEPLLGTINTAVVLLATAISGGKMLVDSELQTTLDYDSGGGTVLREAIGLMFPGAGGPVAAPGDASLGLWTNIKQMPGASKETDAVTVFPSLGFVMDGVTPCVIKRFKANVAAATTDATLIAAVTSKKLSIRSLHINNQGATATDATLNSKPAGAGAAISAKQTLNAYDGRQYGLDNGGVWETVAGEGLSVTTGAGTTLGFDGTYIERA